MPILPVIDLKGQLAVRGIAGRRSEYQPVRSKIAADPSPAAVARALRQRGFSDVYIADLDAIAGHEPDWKSYEQIADTELNLMIDAGVVTCAQMKRLAEFVNQSQRLAAAVIATESIPDRMSLQTALKIFGPQQAVFSLDLKEGRPIVRRSDWLQAGPQEILAEVYAMGYRRVIVLDLTAVGTGGGPATLNLCREIRASFGGVEIISGGGVRNSQDVGLFVSAGCDRVLVASALHDGEL